MFLFVIKIKSAYITILQKRNCLSFVKYSDANRALIGNLQGSFVGARMQLPARLEL